MLDTDQSLSLLARQLRRHTPLDVDDVAALLTLNGTIRTLEPSAYVVREGEAPKFCTFLLSGFAFRQKLTREGTRAIVGLHIPGDAMDSQSLYIAAADHNVQALTRAEVMFVPRADVQRLVEQRPGVAHAVIVNTLVEASIMREWLLNIGRRDARARLAHLLCEFAMRMDAQGLSDDGYTLPMTQEQLGDALGLTSVHVNRTLKALEAEGVLERQGRRIQFQDWEAMRRIADFSALYLHLDLGDQHKALTGISDVAAAAA